MGSPLKNLAKLASPKCEAPTGGIGMIDDPTADWMKGELHLCCVRYKRGLVTAAWVVSR